MKFEIHQIHVTWTKTNEGTCKEENKYFLTPNTSKEKQKAISRYDVFDLYTKAYQKSSTRPIIKKYVIK